MSFYKKYELERLIADGETKTFRAIENSTGRLVFLHMFNPEGQVLLAAIKARLAPDPRNPRPPLIELGEFAGTPFAVTEPLPNFKSLRDWLNQPADPGPPAAPPAKPPSESLDQFEQLFGEPRPAPPPAAVQPPRTEGEFTKFFGASPVPAPPKPQSQSPVTKDDFTKLFGPAPEKAAPKPAPPESDEFTKMFGAKPPAARPSAPAAAPKTGQFTKLFGSGPSGEAINIEEEQARAAKSGTPESRPFQAPSEFTKVFGAEQAAGERTPPKPRPLTIGSASGIFKAPGSPIPGARPPVAARPDAPPGEYTRMIARSRERDHQAASPPGQPGMPPVVTPVPAPKRGLMIALSVGTAVVLLIVFLVIAMVTQKH
jgi:hypothetical protein